MFLLRKCILFQSLCMLLCFLFVLFPLAKLLGSSQHLSSLKFPSNVSLSMFSSIYYILLAPSFWKLLSFIYGKFYFIVLLITSCPVITFQAFVANLLWSKTSRTDLVFHLFYCFQSLTFYLLSVHKYSGCDDINTVVWGHKVRMWCLA